MPLDAHFTTLYSKKRPCGGAFALARSGYYARFFFEAVLRLVVFFAVDFFAVDFFVDFFAFFFAAIVLCSARRNDYF
jgi:hypothetical protein